MLEIYNENLRDLLFDYASGEAPPKLEVRSTQESGCNVPDAVQHAVSCADDVLTIMEMGQKNRSVGSTAMNERSSRSHSVLTVIVDGYSHVTKDRTHGCLHLVDLAGSERVGRSEATGRHNKMCEMCERDVCLLRRPIERSAVHKQKLKRIGRCHVWPSCQELSCAVQEFETHATPERQSVRFGCGSVTPLCAKVWWMVIQGKQSP